MTNELTKGSVVYSYDCFSNLVSAKGTGILSVFRTFDEVGNVYGTEDQSDRIYGAGSRLETSGIDLKEKRNTFQGGYGKLVTKGVEYLYDEEGNLARKVEADGSVWEYSYYGNGLLRKVVRPDKSAVIFKYDALGRRIQKCITKAGSEKVISLEEKAASMKKAVLSEEKWEKIGGVRIRKPNTELQKPHVVQGDNSSIYAGESTLTDSGQNTAMVDKVIHFLWDGNTILHEWEEDATGSKKPQQKIDYQTDYVVKLSEKKMQEAKEKSAKGEAAPESLITWIFQDDFIPRAKITKDGCYSIMTDYLGTPVGAYDVEGNLVWEREFDINGKVMPAGKDSYGRTLQDVGERNFIPFRFQGQYEDEEIGLYYNRFRYYDPQTGQYTQQDPIGLEGGNPTLYGYVWDTLGEVDPFGLFKVWRNLRPDENISDGLSAKIPGRNMSISGHIMNGSKHKGSQFISTTRDPDIAASWREPGQRTVMFDTDDVIPDSLGNRKIIDVSTPEKAAAKGLRGRAYSRAVSSNEVLIEGRVPSNKITVECPG